MCRPAFETLIKQIWNRAKERTREGLTQEELDKKAIEAATYTEQKAVRAEQRLAQHERAKEESRREQESAPLDPLTEFLKSLQKECSNT